MKIRISKGVGQGPTELSAFDKALIEGGVANFNLIYLSSVIPPGSEIIRSDKWVMPEGNWGDRLYVVIAQARKSQRNQEAWAGVGWVQDKKTGRGLFVEHEGHNQAEVKADIKQSLDALCQNRKMEFGPIHMEVVGIKCEDKPVCAMVMAVFDSASWKTNATLNIQRLRKLVMRHDKNAE